MEIILTGIKRRNKKKNSHWHTLFIGPWGNISRAGLKQLWNMNIFMQHKAALPGFVAYITLR